MDPGADTNRTVVTFVGDADAVAEGAFQAIAKAAQVIDMSQHHGAHPRMGATDVCPFIPIAGVTMDDCAALARTVGERVGRELEIPVYLYEAAATRPERKNLAAIRRGEYEGLAEKLRDPDWAPDFGPARFNPKAGATVIGAREFLIAYNVTLNTRDKALATDIAFELREKGRVARGATPSSNYSRGRILTYRENAYPCGNCDFVGGTFAETVGHCREAHGYDLENLLRLNDIDPSHLLEGRKVYRAGKFTHCKAIGWYVDEYKRAQISINLTNYKITPPHLVLEEARRLAVQRGLVVTGSEVVGLIPYPALLEAGRYYLKAQGKSPFVPIPDILQAAVFSMGLSDIAPFDLAKKVIGLPREFANGLAAMTVRELHRRGLPRHARAGRRIGGGAGRRPGRGAGVHGGQPVAGQGRVSRLRRRAARSRGDRTAGEGTAHPGRGRRHQRLQRLHGSAAARRQHSRGAGASRGQTCSSG